MSDFNPLREHDWRGRVGNRRVATGVAPEVVESDASAGSRRGRRALASALIVMPVLVLGVVVAFFVFGRGEAPVPVSVMPSPTATPTPVPTPTPTPSPSKTPPPVVESVRTTAVAAFDPYDAKLSAADAGAIAALADGIVAGERVVITGYVDPTVDTTNDEALSRARAAAIADVLAEHGVTDPVLIPAGASPVGDKAAKAALAKRGIAHNRVAVVSAAVIKE